MNYFGFIIKAKTNFIKIAMGIFVVQILSLDII